MMRYTELIGQCKGGKISPFYLFKGEDEYLKEEAFPYIKNALGENVDFILLYGKEINAQELINRCLSLSLFQKKRLIVVKEAQDLLGKEIAAYARNPSPCTYLILLVKKGMKELEKFSVEFRPLTHYQVFYWIKRKVEEKGKAIDSLAISLLQNYAGNDLRRINEELKKMLCYIGEKKVIEKRDVEMLTPERAAGNIFHMLDCLGQGKRKEALKSLEDLLQEGESAGMILAMIARQFRLIFQVKELMGKEPSAKIAQRLKIHPFYISQYIKQANNFLFEQMQGIFSSLSATELDLKTSKRNPPLALELLFTQLMHRVRS